MPTITMTKAMLAAMRAEPRLLDYFSMTEAERAKIAPEDFAQPPDGYPCDTQDHLDACAKLIGRTPDTEQAEIKKRAIAIAKRKGLELPDTWKDGAKMSFAARFEVCLRGTCPVAPKTRTRHGKRPFVIIGQCTAASYSLLWFPSSH